ncbi:MAG: cyclic nucleotide-binding domain-containing protein [Holophagales bacterium]|nr:cyclic nucleotide-binding domain-containing protein [Holophagales bacterium]
MNVPDLFSKVALFDGLSPADRAAISRVSTLRTYRRGERIVTQGQPGDSFFVLTKGRVAVSILSPEGARSSCRPSRRETISARWPSWTTLPAPRPSRRPSDRSWRS